MKITEHPVSIDDLIVSPEQTAVRSAGVHVSAVINAISTGLGRRDNDFSVSDLNHFALLGRVFEVVLAQSMFPPPRYERLGEIECDGVIGSPDAFDVIDGRVEEFKCTWKSSAHDIRERREYLWQVQSYCYMTDTQKAGLTVLYICGSWKPPIPSIKRYLLEFSKAELKQNWVMIKANAEGL